MKLSYKIQSLAELSEHKQSLLLQVEKIFFDTSARKKFKNKNEKQKFYFNWVDYYIQNFSDEFLIAFNTDANTPKVLGYLSGCSNSQLALDTLAERIGSYSLFEDCFSEYPAHFHINFSPDAQGLGLGTHIVDEYKKLLTKKNIPAVHIITAADARNVSFYFRNNFTDQRERDYMGSRLKFMGCKLM